MLFQKLLNSLGKREKLGLRLTKSFFLANLGNRLMHKIEEPLVVLVGLLLSQNHLFKLQMKYNLHLKGLKW